MAVGTRRAGSRGPQGRGMLPAPASRRHRYWRLAYGLPELYGRYKCTCRLRRTMASCRPCTPGDMCAMCFTFAGDLAEDWQPHLIIRKEDIP